jgi:hypothetical protein
MGSLLNSVVLATESAIKELNVWSITDIAICVSILSDYFAIGHPPQVSHFDLLPYISAQTS